MHANNQITDVDTKSKIFHVAAKLIAQKGYNAVSMREISEQSGVSKPMIYYYFESKEKLYESLMDTGLAYNENQIQEIMTSAESTKDKLTGLFKLQFEQCLKFPEFVKFFLYMFVKIEDTPLGERLRQEESRRKHGLVKLIQEGIRRGEFGVNVKPEIAVEMIIGTITHFMWHQMNSRKKILTDQLAEEIIEVLFKGLNE
jgi:AcrR family transcriptional regulator